MRAPDKRTVPVRTLSGPLQFFGGDLVDLLTGKLGPIYLKYFAAAFGSAMILSIYSLVDMAVVGQYEGPTGTAALAVVAPLWNVIFSLGLLMGIGGSVLYSTLKGSQGSGKSDADEYFTVAVIGSVGISVVAWIAIIFFDEPLLRLCGADSHLLPPAQAYLLPIKYVFPLYLFNQMLAAFLRNDNQPALATAAVLGGGIFNMVGDYVFVFTFDMGAYGAGLATAIGAAITFVIMLTHFWSRKNTLSLPKPVGTAVKLKKIVIVGFPTFFIDLAMGILTVLFNRQIMRYLGSDVLAIYGTIINVSTIVQSCAYSVGQGAQPIISMNFGAGKWQRIKDTLRYALYTVAVFSVFWTAISMIDPNLYVYIFMKPTQAILEGAPAIIRTYSVSFILLPLNVFSTYYFQALMKPGTALLVSILRGCAISGALILLLPAVAGANSIWLAMPITELVVAVYVVFKMTKYTKALSGGAGMRPATSLS